MKTNYKKIILIAMLSAISGWSNIANAQKNWVKYSSNPVLAKSQDSLSISIKQPFVLIDGATYRMWYARGGSGIAYATSPDGIAWTIVDTFALVPSTDVTRFDAAACGDMSVINDGGTYKMWYWGMEGSSKQKESIGYATSVDAKTWTKVDGSGEGKSVYDRTMDGGTSNAIQRPCVIKDGGTYKMWYTRVNVSPSLVHRIAYATSPDGIVWTNVPGTGTNGAVLDIGTTVGKLDAVTVLHASVVKVNNEFQMWYTGTNPDAMIGYATSPDGINWTKIYGTLTQGSCIDDGFQPTVSVVNSSYKMWYRSSINKGINYATSSATSAINDEVNNNDAFNIYPNPSNGKFIIKLENTHPIITVGIYNTLGEKVLQQKASNEIDLSNSPQGMYFVKVYDGNKIYTNKIVVQ